MNIWREIKTADNFVDKYRKDYNKACELFTEAYNIAKDYASFKFQGLVWEVVGVIGAIILFIAPQLPLFTDVASLEVFMVATFASGGFAGSSILSTGKKISHFFVWNRKLEEEKIKTEAFINLYGDDPVDSEQAHLSLELIQKRRKDFIKEFVDGVKKD